jgi:hypothetical protein
VDALGLVTKRVRVRPSALRRSCIVGGQLVLAPVVTSADTEAIRRAGSQGVGRFAQRMQDFPDTSGHRQRRNREGNNAVAACCGSCLASDLSPNSLAYAAWM